MEPAAVVTLIAVALAVVAIAVALITVAGILAQVARRLQVVIAAVSEIPAKVAPAEHVLNRINTDLGDAQGALEGLLAKKTGGVAASTNGGE
jgi:hypothetical protein